LQRQTHRKFNLHSILEEETGPTVTKPFAMRMGVYDLEKMLKAHNGLDEDMQEVLRA